MSKEIFKIYKSKKCFLVVTDYPPEQKKSLRIDGAWSGVVLQFENDESLNNILYESINWLKAELQKEFDNQFSSKKTYQILLNELQNNLQPTLF